ncbi:nucleic-acid-binding protein from transposon X-element [Trichonephila clavata]|uniref:Nucleic-acid-binding protein from transposon X-element n=1 Tax=Trichonephila clavata TaxID=2740835 RepID=A0A8X6LVQ7_TRICU|nr:nucleic-acid-binding protein from transposon X-element [Trichonephila clavata]
MENHIEHSTPTPEQEEFQKGFEVTMNILVNSLNNSRLSTEVRAVIRGLEEMESKLRSIPLELQINQSPNLRQLGDVLDEAKFKYAHVSKMEIAEQQKNLQDQIDAWGLPTKPLEAPFQVILSKKKKGRKNPDDTISESKKAKTDEVITTQNKFADLPVTNSMDTTDPIEGTSTDVEQPAAPQKKFHVPPITIDNVNNQAALLKHLQQITKLKLEAKLIGTKFRIFPQTPYAYSLIRRYISENHLEGYTYMLPQDKKLRAVIRGLPIDMPPMEIISDLDRQGFRVDECHNMSNRRTGAPMPLFMISMASTDFHKSIFRTVSVIGYVKVIVEILRKKYGPPQCFRCQGFFHSSKFCTRTPRCVKCAGNHLAKECEKPFGDAPKCCLCGGEHPANFLGCPKNPKPRMDAEKERKRLQRASRINPEPPKENIWEQRSQIATQSPASQPGPSTSTSQPGPSAAPNNSNPVNSQNFPSDLFEKLNSPAVQDTFDLLEKFITIATTIPTKVGRIRAIRELIADEVPC